MLVRNYSEVNDVTITAYSPSGEYIQLKHTAELTFPGKWTYTDKIKGHVLEVLPRMPGGPFVL